MDGSLGWRPSVWLQSHLAQVVSVNDPEGRHRVQVRLLSFDGFDNQNGPVWARVAVPCAGSRRGAFLLPDLGDEVVVNFVGGDPRFPVVVGSLWNGSAPAPETLGGRGEAVDRWTLVGKAGTRIAIEEPASGSPTVRITTPSGIEAELTDAEGGKIVCRAVGSTITMDPSGVSIQTPATVSVEASQVHVSSGMVQVDAATATFSGVVRCNTLITTTVVASTYTPGVGNVW